MDQYCVDLCEKNHEQYKTEFEPKFNCILEFKDFLYLSARENIRVYCLKHGSFEEVASQLFKDARSRHPCPICIQEIMKQEDLNGWHCASRLPKGHQLSV